MKIIRELRESKFDWLVSEDIYNQCWKADDRDTRITKVLVSLCHVKGRLFEGRELFEQYLNAYTESKCLDKWAIIEAHGFDRNGTWTYIDGAKKKEVQSLINKLDGKYGGLVLCICNGGNHTPTSRESLLMISDKRLILNYDDAPDNCINIIDPEQGELDSYTIEAALDELKFTLRG